MMNKNKISKYMMNAVKYRLPLLLLTIASMSYSCLDADIEEAIDYEDYYRNLDDADAAVLGVYGKVMGLAERLVVLNELRGDLVEVTAHAGMDLIEINRQEASADNPWADITPFYEVIQNCNDILYNYDSMLQENRLTGEEYKERYSDIAAIRCWLYYQLGVQFGTIPYITAPIANLKEALAQSDNLLNLDALVPALISVMEQLPTLDDYKLSKLVTGTVDGVSLVPFFINKKILLGDLYLFNDQFDQAATKYREVLSIGENLAADQNDNSLKYRLYVDRSWSAGTTNQFTVLYQRYKEEDIDTQYNAWAEMFQVEAASNRARYEMIWEMTFDYKFAPTYPFISLFSSAGKGKYLLKPSKHAVETLWGQRQKNDFPYDCRGISGGITQNAAGEYEVAKYAMTYDLENPTQQSGKWYLYRAALLHLRFAEAANRSESGGGYPRLALALMNDGIIGASFKWINPETGLEARGDSCRFSAFGPGIENAYPAPYFFDGRMNDQPYIRAPWRYSGGVRGRANMPDVTLEGITTRQDSINTIERMLVREAGLEAGFEGHRWTDLIRVARRLQRLNGTGGQYLRQVMAPKYEAAGLPVPDFSVEEKWYLPLYR